MPFVPRVCVFAYLRVCVFVCLRVCVFACLCVCVLTYYKRSPCRMKFNYYVFFALNPVIILLSLFLEDISPWWRLGATVVAVVVPVWCLRYRLSLMIRYALTRDLKKAKVPANARCSFGKHLKGKSPRYVGVSSKESNDWHVKKTFLKFCAFARKMWFVSFPRQSRPFSIVYSNYAHKKKDQSLVDYCEEQKFAIVWKDFETRETFLGHKGNTISLLAYISKTSQGPNGETVGDQLFKLNPKRASSFWVDPLCALCVIFRDAFEWDKLDLVTMSLRNNKYNRDMLLRCLAGLVSRESCQISGHRRAMFHDTNANDIDDQAAEIFLCPVVSFKSWTSDPDLSLDNIQLTNVLAKLDREEQIDEFHITGSPTEFGWRLYRHPRVWGADVFFYGAAW